MSKCAAKQQFETKKFMQIEGAEIKWSLIVRARAIDTLAATLRAGHGVGGAR